MIRECGDCQLCCKLLPMQAGVIESGAKAAGERCPHQRHGKGCMIYSRRPISCAIWNCRWLVKNDTDNLPRPDRAHYVIDIMPDFVVARPHDGSPETNIEVVQVWIDQDYPEAWQDKRLLAYLERRGAEGIAAMIRFNEREAFVVFPPNMMADGKWHRGPARTADQRTHLGRTLLDGLARAREARS